MTQALRFTVPGEPVPKHRARHVPRLIWVDGEPKAVVSVHTPTETVRAEQVVRDCFAARHPGHRPWTRAVMVSFVAVFPVPPSWPKYLHEAARRGTLYHTSVPDKDNIEKMLVDALKGVAWIDDGQVQGGGIKRYGSPARIEVTLEAIDQPEVPATPGQRALEKRVAAGEPVSRPKKPRRAAKPRTRGADAPHAPAHDTGNPTKPVSTKRYPPALRARIDAALERDRRS